MENKVSLTKIKNFDDLRQHMTEYSSMLDFLESRPPPYPNSYLINTFNKLFYLLNFIAKMCGHSK